MLKLLISQLSISACILLFFSFCPMQEFFLLCGLHLQAFFLMCLWFQCSFYVFHFQCPFIFFVLVMTPSLFLTTNLPINLYNNKKIRFATDFLQASQFLTENLAIIIDTLIVHDSEDMALISEAISNQGQMETRQVGSHLRRGAQTSVAS